MYSRDIITLRQIKQYVNDYGSAVDDTTDRVVFGDKLNVNSTEFYQAMEQDLKPAVKFKIRLIDYQNEKWFLYNDELYKIIRNEDPDGEFIILVGEGVV